MLHRQLKTTKQELERARWELDEHRNRHPRRTESVYGRRAQRQMASRLRREIRGENRGEYWEEDLGKEIRQEDRGGNREEHPHGYDVRYVPERLRTESRPGTPPMTTIYGRESYPRTTKTRRGPSTSSRGERLPPAPPPPPPGFVYLSGPSPRRANGARDTRSDAEQAADRRRARRYL